MINESTSPSSTNTSGQGKNAAIPPEAQGWSWGAFWLTWIWGIGNNTFRAFWIFCPFVNIIMWFVLGAKGRQWAWQHKRWNSIEQYNRVQKRWGLVGLILFLVFSIGWAVSISGTFLLAFGMLNKAEPTKMALVAAQQSAKLQNIVGIPLRKVGNAKGNIHWKNGRGSAYIHFPVSGPISRGNISFAACRVRHQWYLTYLRYSDATNPAKSAQLAVPPAPCGHR